MSQTVSECHRQIGERSKHDMSTTVQQWAQSTAHTDFCERVNWKGSKDTLRSIPLVEMAECVFPMKQLPKPDLSVKIPPTTESTFSLGTGSCCDWLNLLFNFIEHRSPCSEQLKTDTSERWIRSEVHTDCVTHTSSCCRFGAFLL